MSYVLSVGLLQLLVVLGAEGQGIPGGLPPAAEDPALAAVAPPQCLAYLSWAGTAAPDPKSTNRTEQLLAEPEVQKLIGAVGGMIKKAILANAEKGQPGAKEMTEEGLDLAMTVLKHPGAIYLSKFQPPDGDNAPELAGGVIISLGEDADKVWGAISKYQQLLGPQVKTVKIGEETWHRMKPAPDAPEFTWGLHGKRLIVGLGVGEVEGMLQRMDQTPPAWLAAVRKRLPIERQSVFFFINARSVVSKVSGKGGPEVDTVIDALGLKGLTAYATVTGLDAGGYASKSLLGVQGEPAGVLAILKQKPLTAEDLAPLPKDAIVAMALRMDLDVAWEKGLAIAAQVNPAGAKQFTDQVAAAEAQLGLKVRDDLLKPLGDVWCISSAPPQGPLPIPRVLAVVSLRDAKRFAATHEKLMTLAAAALDKAPPGGKAPKITRQQVGGREVFTLQTGQPNVPITPSWCVTDKELVVALSADMVQAYLARDTARGSLADVPAVAELLKGPNPPFALAYQDTPQVIRSAYPALQMTLAMAGPQLKQQGIEIDPAILPPVETLLKHFRPSVSAVAWSKVGLQTSNAQTVPGENISSSTPVLIALLLPAVSSAREAARRSQSMNNLKQIGLALHNYHDQHGSLPPAYTTTKDGKPGLSWRVAILPYLEQEALYKQFRLDEPWDSEHNKALLDKIPATFVSPNYSGPRGKTNYLGIGGEKGIFGGAKGVKFSQITDGTSNTVMVVEANNASAVEWTKPDVFVPDAERPINGLTGLRPGGFNALFGDASVRFLSERTSFDVLKAFFTYNGGEAVQGER